MSRGPSTQRSNSVNVIAAQERLHTCKTVKMSRGLIAALLENERAESQTCRVAEEVSEEETCVVCLQSNASVDEDPLGEFEWICNKCLDARGEVVGEPTRWDHRWESGKANR